MKVFKKEPIIGTAYLQTNVPNGRHVYLLAALSACGIEGPRAQALAAVGDVTPPARVIDLTASANQSNVSLTWTAVGDADTAG